MTTASACGPVDGTVDVVEPGAPGERPARCEVGIPETERVLAGHFPGFPILPGVCVVEYVQRGALATLPGPDRRWRLAALESSRFLSPVYPGDTLSCELNWTREGADWRCRARAATGRGPAAQIRLRFTERTAKGAAG
ncbi:3-hydroxyacyl-ACP dehydratase [Streptomyces sp. NPDC048636]|uniref:3-hydroxyacyl-ACP dehydratase FabZ family protein n=1 Tax=Streptomyces sp. NPDC048636 TaxID=3155762 RepID=UPI003448BDE8